MSDFNFYTEGQSVIERWGQSIQGKTVAITGTSERGLGAATAIALSKFQPSHLLLLARNLPRVQSVLDSVKEISPQTQATFIPIELSDFDFVRKAATQILGLVDKIDILINNAGVMAIPWAKNNNGIERTLAINHLGHFLFTKMLMPAILDAGPGARIVNLSSGAYKMAPFDFGDWNFSDGKTYDPMAAYAQSKTANILFTVGLAKRAEKYGVQAFAVHPGFILGTSLVTHLPDIDFASMDALSRKKTGFPFEKPSPKSLEQGISTTLVAVLSPDLANQSGAYLQDCQVCETREYAHDGNLADQLWELSEELVGGEFQIGAT